MHIDVVRKVNIVRQEAMLPKEVGERDRLAVCPCIRLVGRAW